MTLGATFTPTTKVAGGPPAPKLWDRRRYIHFFGEAFSNATFNFSFDVLAGDTPPTIVDGYAQWAPAALPLRVGLIVYTGRSPVAMQVAVRFMQFDSYGSWLTDDTAGLAVEKQIELLEWMAGESIQVGPSPLVYLSTYDGNGNTTPLIPFEYQTVTSNVPAIFGGGDAAPWVVTALAWDPDPVRTANYYRIRQDATVTLTLYNAPAGASSTPNLPRPKAIRVTSRPGADTALTIARSVPSNDVPKLAAAIMVAPQNAQLRLRSVNYPIAYGKTVYVPDFGATVWSGRRPVGW
jgi:hypothetical protein